MRLTAVSESQTVVNRSVIVLYMLKARPRGGEEKAERRDGHSSPGTTRRSVVEALDSTQRFVFFSRRPALRFNRHDIYIG